MYIKEVIVSSTKLSSWELRLFKRKKSVVFNLVRKNLTKNN